MSTAAAIEQDVFTGQDFYVPGYKVLIRGKEIKDVRYDILNVSYTDKLEEMDSCSFTLNNWDPNGKQGNASGPARG